MLLRSRQQGYQFLEDNDSSHHIRSEADHEVPRGAQNSDQVSREKNLKNGASGFWKRREYIETRSYIHMGAIGIRGGIRVFGAHSTKSDAHNVLSQLHCIYRSRQDWSLGTNSRNSLVFWSPLEMRKACCIVTLNIHSPNLMIVCQPLFNSRLVAYHCGAWILVLEFFMMIFRIYVWILVGIS